MRSLELLAYVAREGRYLTGESPEQVGDAAGISGRTIRRIERQDLERRPRRLTLETLAHYYSLDPALLVWLAASKLDGDKLEEELRGRAEQAGLASAGMLGRVALALARSGGDGPALVPEHEQQLVDAFRRLEGPRQRIAAVLVQQLLLAQAEDRRRREGGRKET